MTTDPKTDEGRLYIVGFPRSHRGPPELSVTNRCGKARLYRTETIDGRLARDDRNGKLFVAVDGDSCSFEFPVKDGVAQDEPTRHGRRAIVRVLPDETRAELEAIGMQIHELTVRRQDVMDAAISRAERVHVGMAATTHTVSFDPSPSPKKKTRKPTPKKSKPPPDDESIPF